jgi:hypothetical protein
MALAYTDDASASCTNQDVYAHIIEILDGANWYDNVIGLSIEDGNFTLTASDTTKQLVVYAIRSNGDAPFIAPNADLDFTSATPATASAGLHTGLITRVAAGTTYITAVITAVPAIEAIALCTVSS